MAPKALNIYYLALHIKKAIVKLEKLFIKRRQREIDMDLMMH